MKKKYKSIISQVLLFALFALFALIALNMIYNYLNKNLNESMTDGATKFEESTNAADNELGLNENNESITEMEEDDATELQDTLADDI